MKRPLRVVSWILVCSLAAASVNAKGRFLGRNKGPEEQAREQREAARAERILERRALRNGTLGGGSAPNAVPAPGSYDLSIEGDVNLGGAVFKGGFSFLHADGAGTAVGMGALDSLTTGALNTAVGYYALSANTTGTRNTAVGDYAMVMNTQGSNNTAVGYGALNSSQGYDVIKKFLSANTAVGSEALFYTTTGYYNTAVGAGTLRENVYGIANVAVGYRALYSSTGTQGYGGNTAVGTGALSAVTSGTNNLAVGYEAGVSLSGAESGNILLNSDGITGDGNTLRIGQATGTGDRELDAAFIHGIFGGSVTGVSVLIDSTGKLGTTTSSRRYKDEIRDMGDRSAGLSELRPVTFRYKREDKGENERPLRYGLIAEEVAEVFPELVVFNEDGAPETVKYHLLSSMLLNELQRQNREMGELRRRLEALEGRPADGPVRAATRSSVGRRQPEESP